MIDARDIDDVYRLFLADDAGDDVTTMNSNAQLCACVINRHIKAIDVHICTNSRTQEENSVP
jgi:hypothetical protein